MAVLAGNRVLPSEDTTVTVHERSSGESHPSSLFSHPQSQTQVSTDIYRDLMTHVLIRVDTQLVASHGPVWTTSIFSRTLRAASKLS